ncbi:MAG: phenylalanine--tRNA ligase subunit alpha [Candidatus Bathyarchaeia archaeon]
MKPEEVAKRLHENEREVLLALADSGSSTTEELRDATGLSKDAVEKACAWAETKRVLNFREEVSHEFSIRREGERYVRLGLPEKRLISLVSRGTRCLSELKDKIENLNIALVWLRRNQWGEINQGKVKLTGEGREACKRRMPEERLLDKLSVSDLRGSELSEEERELVGTLISRNLVEEREEIERWVEITQFGREVIPFLDETPSRKVITQLTPEIIRGGDWEEAVFQRYDVTLPVPSLRPGKRHFISQVIDYIRRFWVELGFKEMRGNYLELSFWNFDALFQPQDHPARDLADTFYLSTPERGSLPEDDLVERVKKTHENGWNTGSTGWGYEWNPDFASMNCLRTHTTSLSVNQLARLTRDDLPAKFFSIGRVFRNETIDWNHLIEFYQTDGIVVGEGVTFRDLQGYLKAYLEGLGLERFRFRPGYFPYTEMSLEAEVWIEEKGSWMELFGAGIFRPEVVKPLMGFDVPVLAWGPGFDRLVMQSYQVDNIKELYSNDIGLLRSAKLWIGE